MKKSHFFLAIIIIGILYLFFRFYNLPQNLVFRPDQGLHLLESYQMVQSHKIRLLGPIVSSKNFNNRNFFIGANYYYALSALGLLTNWNPLNMTLVYGIIELCFIIYFVFWLKYKFNPLIAAIIFLFLACNPYLISHSRFFWNPHFLIPLGIIEIILLERYFHSQRLVTLLFASFVWGCAFAFHYAAILWVLFYLFIFFQKKLFVQLKVYPVVIFGFILGDFPFFLSEFKHNFYNFRTIIFVYSHSSQSTQLYSHYFIFPLIIFFFFGISWLLEKYWSRSYFRFSFIGGLLLLTILIKPVDELSSIPGWGYPDQLNALKFILADGCPQNYNVAETISGDTRSYDLRALLTVRHCPPLPVEDYPQAQIIFLIAPPSRPPLTEMVWEISSFKPFTVKSMVKLNDQVILYRLEKSHATTSKNHQK